MNMIVSPEIAWTLIGIFLIFCEFFIPGVVFAFFGVGALITAFTTWLGLTPAFSGQLIVFIVSSLLLLVFLRRYFKHIFLGNQNAGKDEPYVIVEVGKIVPVIELIEPGEVGGKVKYQGTIWQARANETIAPGESVKITGYENLTLVVEKIKKED